MVDHRGKCFGLLCYPGTDNLGDEIQSLAAKRFIPRVSRYLNREALNEIDAPARRAYWTIMNGWYTHNPQNWPPSNAIRPLFIAVHITQERASSGLRPSDVFLAEPLVNYLHAARPIGARDLSTLKLLRNAGVASYFSGCLTLTLQRPRVPRDNDLVVLNDVSDRVRQFICANTAKKLVLTTHTTGGEGDSAKRFARAQQLISTYAQASCVITSRLHCALPCLAIGTPVLFIARAHDQYRFSGLLEMTHNCNENDLLSGKCPYDVNHPPLNRNIHMQYRVELQRRVTSFVNEMSAGDERGWYAEYEGTKTAQSCFA